MSKFLIKLISTFFYAGYLPFMPGTFASIAALLIFVLIKGNFLVSVVLTIVFLASGFLVSGKAESLWKKKDPHCVVIDEVCGMFLCLLFSPYSIKTALAAFLIFRIFDIFKPFPVKTIQNLKGSLGVMGDDIVASVYTVLIIKLAFKIFFR